MKAKLLILGVFIFLLSSCDLIGELQEDKTEYVRKSQLQIGKLFLFTEKDDLIDYLGKPDSVIQDFYHYDGLKMYVAMDSVIWEISTSNPNYSTPDGIRVGDSKEKVIETYGETETWKDESEETLVYQNYHFFQRPPLYLYFDLKEDTVKEISLWFHYE